MSAVTDEQILADGDTGITQPRDLRDQRNGIDDNAVADDANFSTSQNSRGDQMQDVFESAMNHGVPGIVPSLAAHDNIRRACENVDDLTLPFVAPLRTDQDCVRHFIRRLTGKKFSRRIRQDAVGTCRRTIGSTRCFSNAI